MIEKTLYNLTRIPTDKLLHSFYGTLVYSVVALANPIVALITVAALAVTKEIYDYTQSNHTASWQDVVATVGIPGILTLGYYI